MLSKINKENAKSKSKIEFSNFSLIFLIDKKKKNLVQLEFRKIFAGKLLIDNNPQEIENRNKIK